jgi:hypothetical protein
MIDALTGVLYHAGITKQEIAKHTDNPPFKLTCWERGIIPKIMSEQQTKADEFIKKSINKIEFKDQEENSVLEVPDQVRNIHGFTSIPPFLRVFPSNLALQNIKGNNYIENVEESELLKIKNKREIEDKVVDISLQENLKKKQDDIDTNLLESKLKFKFLY